MPQRYLTAGERLLLRPIFSSTVNYDTQQIGRNDAEWGGSANSITVGAVPMMSKTVWSLDYAAAPDGDVWVFIHEIAHVWQYFHGQNKVLEALKTWWEYDRYKDAYKYDLSSVPSLHSYNFEAQASIIADYWYVTKGLAPRRNIGTRKALTDYVPFIQQLWASGPPEQENRKLDKESGFKV